MYVRFPPESEETAADLARIKRTAQIISSMSCFFVLRAEKERKSLLWW